MVSVFVLTKDNGYFSSLIGSEEVKWYDALSDLVNSVSNSGGENSVVLIDAETFGKEDVEKNFDMLSLLVGKSPIVVTRCVRYTPFSDYVKLSDNIVVAETNDDVTRFVEYFATYGGIVEDIQFGEWNLNVPSRELSYKGGIVVTLNTKSFYVLQELLKHKNEFVSREALMRTAWEDVTFKKSRSMDVYIVQLKHLFEIDNRVRIDNRYGVGFGLFVEE